MINTNSGPKIKSCVGRGGIVANITYQNITLNNVVDGMQIGEYYKNNDCMNNSDSQIDLPIVKDIVYNNIYGTVAHKAGFFDCLKQQPCTNLIMNNINIVKYLTGFSCEYANGTANNVSPRSCL